jgi:hypothetical protein
VKNDIGPLRSEKGHGPVRIGYVQRRETSSAARCDHTMTPLRQSRAYIRAEHSPRTRDQYFHTEAIISVVRGAVKLTG